MMTLTQTEYPKWRVIAWRGLRTFIVNFLLSGSVTLIIAKEVAFTSWNNFLTIILFPFVIAGLTGGTIAFGKYLRITFGIPNQDSKIDKIPI